MDTPTADALTATLHRTIPATARLGITVVEVGPGEVSLRVPIEGNANHFGAMYAGALFAVAELPGGLIPLMVLGPAFTPILTDMRTRFLAPARTDITVTARMDPAEVTTLAEVATAEGRAEFTLDLEGTDTNGRTVVATTGQYQLRPSRG